MQFGSIAARVPSARRRTALLAGAAAVTAAVCAPAAATAADPAPYGELARWGGAAAVGDARVGLIHAFTADPVDDTVFVVDRTANTATGESTFRVRKFAGLTGELLGTGSFTATSPVVNRVPDVSGLAVDHASGHLYAGVVHTTGPSQPAVLQQIRVIGTTPTAGALTPPADVADGTLLDAAPATAGANVVAADPVRGSVVVGGVDAVSGFPRLVRFRGVARGGSVPGDADGSWTGDTASQISSLSVDGDSRIYATTKPQGTEYIGGSVVRIGADLAAGATPLLPTATQGPDGSWFSSQPATRGTAGQFGIRAFGTHVAVTPSGELIASYAGGVQYLYEFGALTEPFTSEGGLPKSFGIRRFAADGEDLGVIGGGGAAGAACHVAVPASVLNNQPIGAYGLALGSGGKLFTPSWLDGNALEIVAFGPGGSGCPVPRPALAARTAEGTVGAGRTVPLGAEVTLDLSGSDLATWPLLEVDWDLDGDATNGSEGDGFETKHRRPLRTVDPATPAPSLTTRRTWTTAGTFPVRARILTIAGTAEISAEVRVAAAPLPPLAALTGPALGTAGTAVTFDASGSKPQPDGSTAPLNHEWDFGDSAGAFTAGAARQAHTYAAAGTYSVRVRVTDSSNGRQVVSATRTIVVRAAAGPIERPIERPIDIPIDRPIDRQPPPPADTTPPALTIRATTAIGRNGALALQLGCPAGEGSCAGTAELKTAGAVASAGARRGRGRRAKRSVLTLGRATFTTIGGRAATVSLKLSAAGRKLLAKSKKLKVVLTVVVRDAAGNAATSRKTLTLTVARARGRARGRRR